MEYGTRMQMTWSTRGTESTGALGPSQAVSGGPGLWQRAERLVPTPTSMHPVPGRDVCLPCSAQATQTTVVPAAAILVTTMAQLQV